MAAPARVKMPPTTNAESVFEAPVTVGVVVVGGPGGKRHPREHNRRREHVARKLEACRRD
jgi:hypothetical protein